MSPAGALNALPELVVTPSAAQIFMFSAVTWNRHHVHYDKDAALAEGLPGVVVQRGLIGNFLARLLTNWLGDSGEVRELSWKVLQSALPNHELRCQGTITGREGSAERHWAFCELKVLDDQNRLVATGEARVEMFRAMD